MSRAGFGGQDPAAETVEEADDDGTDHHLLTAETWIRSELVGTMFPMASSKNDAENDTAKKSGAENDTAEQESEASELFWDLAAELQANDPRVVEGTIMSSACLRVGKEFLAMNHHKKEGLVVKLPAERVRQIIDAGEGESFAPAGKVFKEWLAVTTVDEARWRELLQEGITFVG